MTLIIAFYCLLVCVLAVSDERLKTMHKGFIKMTASSIFLLIPFTGSIPHDAFSNCLLLGLCLCWVGDLCLVWKGTGFRFKLGLLAFLCAHIAYAAGFLIAESTFEDAALYFVFLIGVGLWVYQRVRTEVERRMRFAVLVYIFALTAMTALSWSLTSQDQFLGFAFAATAFMISDISVALQRFGKHSQYHRLWGVPLYFSAQIIIAIRITEPLR